MQKKYRVWINISVHFLIQKITYSYEKLGQFTSDNYIACAIMQQFVTFSVNPNLHWNIFATVYKGNIIKNLIMDCQSYTKYRPNETKQGHSPAARPSRRTGSGSGR